MRLINLSDLKGYTKILSLPSFFVMEKKFHQYIIHQRVMKNRDLVEVVAEGRFPGLTTDPDVVIPAGMWRELLKVLKKSVIQPQGLGDGPAQYDEMPPPPPPRVNQWYERDPQRRVFVRMPDNLAGMAQQFNVPFNFDNPPAPVPAVAVEEPFEE